jgi:hypothetical protein
VKRKWLLMTEIPSVEETATGEGSEPPGKCTTQPVLTAALKLRFLLNLIQTDRSIAETAFPTTGSPERTDIKSEFSLRNSYFYRVCPSCLIQKADGDSFSIMILLGFFLNSNPLRFILNCYLKHKFEPEKFCP